MDRNCVAYFVPRLLFMSILYNVLKSIKTGILVRNGVNAHTKSFVFEFYKNLADRFIKNVPPGCYKITLLFSSALMGRE